MCQFGFENYDTQVQTYVISFEVNMNWCFCSIAQTSILDFIREDLLAHFSFPFWLHTMIGQLTGCSKKRAKADWLMTCAKADWLRTNVMTFFLIFDWLVQNLLLF